MPPKKDVFSARLRSKKDECTSNKSTSAQLLSNSLNAADKLQHSNMQSTPTISSAAGAMKEAELFSSSSNNISNAVINNGDDVQALFLRMVKEFADKLERIRADFQRQITDLHTSISQLMCGFNNKQYKEIDMRMDLIERQIHSNTLVIDGIPYSQCKGDAAVFLNSLCTSINTQVPAYDDIFTTKQRGSTNDSGSIIIKLRHNVDKFKLLKAARATVKAKKVKALTLNDIGISSNERIYIHESLTKRNYRIFRELVRLKKKLNYKSVFTSNGRVFIKLKADSQPQYISCLDDLKAINNNMNICDVEDLS